MIRFLVWLFVVILFAGIVWNMFAAYFPDAAEIIRGHVLRFLENPSQFLPSLQKN